MSNQTLLRPVIRERTFGVVLVLLASAPMVAAIALGRTGLSIAYAFAPATLLAMLAISRLASHIRPGARTLATTWVLLVASTFVWRGRTTSQLNSNPLDRAGLLRVALVSIAGLLALGFFTRRKVRTLAMPGSLRWFCAYLAVAFASAAASPLPLQAFYRVFEFAVGVVAIVIVALSIEEPGRPRFLFRLAQTTIAGIVAVVWLEAIIVPRRGWEATAGIDPYSLHGYLPAYASNSVGTYGGLLAIMSLPFITGQQKAARYQRVCLGFGIATLVATQYRTGIVAFLVAAPLILRTRHRVAIASIIAATAAVVFVAGHAQQSLTLGTSAFNKGRPEVVSTLDSRTTYWKAAAGLVRQRPELGWGLDVGSRRALVSLGNETGSTIHGTWFEALLGTGIVGTVMLALSFLFAFRGAWTMRMHPIGAGSAGVIAFLLIRSITGTTIELFSDVWMIYAAVVLATYELARRRPMDLQYESVSS